MKHLKKINEDYDLASSFGMGSLEEYVSNVFKEVHEKDPSMTMYHHNTKDDGSFKSVALLGKVQYLFDGLDVSKYIPETKMRLNFYSYKSSSDNSGYYMIIALESHVQELLKQYPAYLPKKRTVKTIEVKYQSYSLITSIEYFNKLLEHIKNGNFDTTGKTWRQTRHMIG